MKRCESCGAENSAQATFCAKCGKNCKIKNIRGGQPKGNRLCRKIRLFFRSRLWQKLLRLQRRLLLNPN